MLYIAISRCFNAAIVKVSRWLLSCGNAVPRLLTLELRNVTAVLFLSINHLCGHEQSGQFVEAASLSISIRKSRFCLESEAFGRLRCNLFTPWFHIKSPRAEFSPTQESTRSDDGYFGHVDLNRDWGPFAQPETKAASEHTTSSCWS